MQKIPRRDSLQSLHVESEEIGSPSEKGNFPVFEENFLIGMH